MGVLWRANEAGGRWLIVVAAPREVEAVVAGLGGEPPARGRAGDPGGPWRPVHEDDRFAVVSSGVGKANAAGATAAALARGGFGGALSLGIGGALPGSGLATRDVVVADESVLADEGLETGEGFVDLRAMGFGPAPDGGMGVASDPGVADALVAGLGATRGVVATVSICSGTDARAEWVRSRTGAVVEAMEGAAVGLSARSMGGAIAFAEVRVVSNTTGDRGGQAWDLEGALGRLEAVARSM